MVRALVTWAVLGWAISAGAAPRIAVMPFKDLMDGKGSVGEAIRETVTTDLKEVSGLQVVERGQIDQVIGELKLEGAKNDLGPAATMKVGALVSATLVVIGSYQAYGATARVSARFVDVKTGEVVGAAKVDGPVTDFLRLQDRITVELLKSAKMDVHTQQRFARRPRPRLHNLKPMELYGDALVEADAGKRRALLVAALGEAPTFHYAARDLAALEEQLKKLAAVSQVAQSQALDEHKKALDKATDGDQRAILQNQLLAGLLSARRFRTLVVEARAMRAKPGAPPKTNGLVPGDELAGSFLVMALSMLKEHDQTIAEGTEFLRRHPRSVYYSTVQGMVQSAITAKRQVEDGKQKLAEHLPKVSSSDRWDLCFLGELYQGFYQHVQAQALVQTCLEVGIKPRREVLKQLLWIDLAAADWAAARRELDALDKEQDPEMATTRSFAEAQIPSDAQ